MFPSRKNCSRIGALLGLALLLTLAAGVRTARAQDEASAEADIKFYDDDPEAANPADVPTAGSEPAPDAVDDSESDGLAGALEDALTPEARAEYTAMLRELIQSKREQVLGIAADKILAKQESRMTLLADILGYFALAGLLLLLLPFYLIKRYPGKFGLLFKYSALASASFILAVLMFACVALLLKTTQGQLGTITNPKLAVIETAFDSLDENIDVLAEFGPTLIEPTLQQLQGDSDDTLPVALLNNVQSVRSDLQVFGTVAKFFKSINGVFGYIPVLLTVVALAMFGLAVKPTLIEIVTMPARAASGAHGVGRAVLKRTFGTIGREFLATLCLSIVLILLTLLSGVVMYFVVKPAVEAFMAYLLMSFMYIQMESDASTGLILLSLSSTIIFLLLNFLCIILGSVFVLGKTQKIFQQRFHDRVPLRTHRRFWKWGILSVLWLFFMPLLYILGAEPAVDAINTRLLAGDSMNWNLVLSVGPVMLVAVFGLVFWATRGGKALQFLMTYNVKGQVSVAAVDGAFVAVD